jgi:hypothetical protein
MGDRVIQNIPVFLDNVGKLIDLQSSLCPFSERHVFKPASSGSPWFDWSCGKLEATE